MDPLSDGWLYGWGCFETMGLVDGKIRFVDDHWERLGSAAEVLSLELPLKRKDLLRLAEELAEANGCRDGVARLSLHRGEDSGARVEWLLRVFPGGMMVGSEPLRVVKSRFPHLGPSPLSEWKHNNYLHNLMAFREARSEGWDEAILCRENEVIEGCLSSLWVLVDGELLTPPLQSGALRGVVRERILRSKTINGNTVRECPLAWQNLFYARAVFLSNAAMILRPIGELGGHPISLDENFHEILVSEILKN